MEVFLCFQISAHLFELLVRETVELDDELAVGGRDLSTWVDDLDDVQLLPEAHLCADLPTQVLDVLHLEEETTTQRAIVCLVSVYKPAEK